jgi:two-component system, NarL family, sensor histidine kinase UhpB
MVPRARGAAQGAGMEMGLMIFMIRRSLPSHDGNTVMTLRLKLHLIVGGLTLLFVIGMLGLQARAMRESVREEVVAANRVAVQMLGRLALLPAAQAAASMRSFLDGVGRIRSSDVLLYDQAGRELYRSPPSPYKAGRDAPAWFAALVAPPLEPHSVALPDGRLVVRANASRAALDAWDDFWPLAATALALLLLLNVLVGWVLGRTVRPFKRIVQALGEVEAGRFDTTLPALPGREAGMIGAAFNRMASVLHRHLDSEKRALRAELDLAGSRELTRWIDHHIEQERRTIARELHDELGQSVTAIRSLALAIAQRGGDAAVHEPARLIADEASRLYDAMHGLIPRLTPLVLDRFGLPDALTDLAERTQRAHAGVTVELDLRLDGAHLGNEAALALYRAAQEGITNALRHGDAHLLRLSLRQDGDQVQLSLTDNGRGLASDWSDRPGHHGLRWLAERVQSLQGRFSLGPAAPHGACLRIELPLAAAEGAA